MMKEEKQKLILIEDTFTKNMKKHFAILESTANESDNNDYWSDSVCGLETENVTNNWEYVNCKKCLKRKQVHEHGMKEAMEHNIRDMAGFVEFMEKENVQAVTPNEVQK